MIEKTLQAVAGKPEAGKRFGVRSMPLLGVALLLAIFLVQAVSMPFWPVQAKTVASGPLDIVAAENFYQDIAAQLAGPYARVNSVQSDPNIDPHEFEPSVKDAMEVAGANLVIENGGGYDEWMKKLLSASPNPGRLVINAFDISPVKLPENEHVWYSMEDMKAVAAALTKDLKTLRPQQAARFDKNLQVFDKSLEGIEAKMREVSKRFSGAPIALTEPIFLYQSVPMGLKVLTPFAFQKAVAQGIDPPADAVLSAREQVKKKLVRALVYNQQTADRFTEDLKELAKRSGVPVVGVTETMPPGKHYQSWMLDQIEALESALGSGAAGGAQ
ncbi:MAG: metal ABC transporter solute-binding protein, Zn/Mn family [Syntrophobacteraceae bacterium]